MFQRLLESPHQRGTKHFGAFYSSILGGIVNEPGLMVLHIDDHMVHKGHGVYDVVPLVGGTLYQLDEHVERIAAGAEAVGINLPMSTPAIKRVLLDTAAASLKLNGHVQFWITAGRGGLSVSDAECTEPGLYVLCSSEYADPADYVDRTEGWRAASSPVDAPSNYFAAIKSSSMLQGVVAQLEAEGRDYDVGLYVDAEGNVLGGPNSNLAIITQDNTFVYTNFDRAPHGITVQTLAALIPDNANPDDLPIDKVEQRPITSDDVMGALEAMLINSIGGVVPITHLDGAPIADGTAGAIALALQQLLINDREPREGSPRHVPVPYGALTGMRNQLV